MIGRSLSELHVELLLHGLVFLFLGLILVSLWLLLADNFDGLVQEPVNLLSHLLPLIFSGHLLTRLGFFDKVLEIHVFISWELSLLPLSLAPILRQSLPIEVFWPLAQVESKLEPHVGWKSDEVIQVIRSEDSSDMSVGADVDGPYLVASVD